MTPPADLPGSADATATTPPAPFGDRLTARVRERESQVVLGLDPDPTALWPGATDAGYEPPADASPAVRAAAAVRAHCMALIDAAGPACVAVKPQLARFEALGAAGWAALEAVVAYAHEAGLLVIADAKRGDIDVSARAYAQALIGGTDTPFGHVRGLGADMMTVNPLMGCDAIEPFISVARASGAGVLVIVRTSNPGAADIEDLELVEGGLLWQEIGVLVDALGDEAVGESGLSDVGAVMGATWPAHIRDARKVMPNAVFLLPGVGAQGGEVEDLAAAFIPGRAGGLIAASRSIANAHATAGGSPAQAARAEAERLRELGWDVSR